MKNDKLFGALLVLTIATTGLMVIYNLYLRQSFPVTLKYDFPAVHRAGEPEPAPWAAEDLPPDIEFDEGPGFAHEYAEMQDAFYEDGGEYSDGDVPVSVSFPLDLNMATEAELKFIPQIGDALSQRIVQYREYLGGYTRLEQLMEIKGMGQGTFDRVSPYLYIEQEELS